MKRRILLSMCCTIAAWQTGTAAEGEIPKFDIAAAATIQAIRCITLCSNHNKPCRRGQLHGIALMPASGNHTAKNGPLRGPSEDL
jgi:hypothetical protein